MRFTDTINASSLNRRRFLGASSAITAAILSGATLPAGAGAQDSTRDFQTAWPYPVPPTGHFNVLGSGSIMGPPNIYGDMIWLPMALYTWSTQEWMPLMATNWGFIADESMVLPAEPEDPGYLTGLGLVEPDATIFQVRLREGVVWSNDEPFTSRDVLTTYSIQRLRSDVVWQYLESIEAVDDYTVNFVMKQPSTVVQRYILRMSPQSTAIYGEWATQVDEIFASGGTLDDPEARQLLDQFNEFRPSEVIASGPFTIDMDSITNAELYLVKNDQAWNADQVAFDSIRNFNGLDDSINAIILSGEIDYATQSFTPAVEQELVQTGQRIIRPPVYTGPAILFNYGRYPQFGDTRVRHAFAHVIDRQQNGFVALGESGVPVQYMSGISENTIGDWLSQEDIDALNQYPVDTDQATALLEEAGWTRDGASWVMDDGSPAQFEILIPVNSPDWSASGMDAAEQLSAFGIEVTVRAVPVAQQAVDTDLGNFDLSVRYWGNSNNPHPHFSFAQSFFNHNTLARNAGGEGMQFPLIQETEVAGEVDLEQLTLDAADGLDEEAQRENVTILAKVFNELLPSIPLFERYGNNSVLEGVRAGEWPPDEDPVYLNSPYADGIVTIFMLRGDIQPVEDV